MQYFWDHGSNTVSAVIELMPEEKPPHSTISSLARILEKKGFLTHKAYGRTYEYIPVITKKAYTKFSIKQLVRNYFQGSASDLVSFIVEEEDLSLADLSIPKIKNDE
mgnify:FL=1